VPPTGIADTLRGVRRGDDERANARATGRDDSEEEGQEDGDHGPAPRTLGRMIRSHRLLSVAASLIVLLALTGGAVALGTTSGAPKATLGAKPLERALPPSTRHAAGSAANSAKKNAGSSLAGTASSGSTTGAAGTGSTGSTAGTAGSGSTSFSTLHTALGAPAAANAPAATSTTALPAGAVGQPARIEQTGSLDLTVARGALSSTMDKLTSLASAYGGFVANSQTQSSGSAASPPSGTVTLQVPVADFSSLLTQAKSLGKTSALTTKATDVTGQYVDLQSRISALEASRQQYLTILARASSVGDVLAVQAQLDNLQSQIEQLQGQLGVLGSETNYSTLTVSVTEAGRPHHHRSPPAAVSGAAKAWHDSVHGFAVGVDGIIRLAGPALFALLCLAALVLGGRFTWRRLQRHAL
jgi:hypothetical protein